MMKKPLGIAVVVAIATALFVPISHSQTPGPVGSADAGRSKTSMCIGCHGLSGYKTAYPEVYSVPKISGQNQQYIIKALQGYRAGDRKHPSMMGIARSLSDQDMADLAAYYGSASK